MSRWTHIRGVIYVDVPGGTQKEKDFVIDDILNHLPEISGSEGDLEYTFAPIPGYNESSNYDNWDRCTAFKQFRTIELLRGRELVHTQSIYAITLYGNQRGCDFDTCYREFIHWLMTLGKRLEIINVVVSIYGDTEDWRYKENSIIFNHNKLNDIFGYDVFDSKYGIESWFDERIDYLEEEGSMSLLASVCPWRIE